MFWKEAMVKMAHENKEELQQDLEILGIAREVIEQFRPALEELAKK